MLSQGIGDADFAQTAGEYSQPRRICLFEFDERFAVMKEFIHYDFHSPLKLPCTLPFHSVA